MTQEEINDNARTNMVNDIIFLNDRLSELWNFHSENPNRINVEEEYEALRVEIESLEVKIEELD